MTNPLITRQAALAASKTKKRRFSNLADARSTEASSDPAAQDQKPQNLVPNQNTPGSGRLPTRQSKLRFNVQKEPRAPDHPIVKRPRIANRSEAVTSPDSDVDPTSLLDVAVNDPEDNFETCCWSCIAHLCSMPDLVCKIGDNKIRQSIAYQPARCDFCKNHRSQDCLQPPEELIPDVRRLQKLAIGLSTTQDYYERIDHLVEMRKLHFSLEDRMSQVDPKTLERSVRTVRPALNGNTATNDTNETTEEYKDLQQQRRPLTQKSDPPWSFSAMCELLGPSTSEDYGVSGFFQKAYILNGIRSYKLKVFPDARPFTMINMNIHGLSMGLLMEDAKTALARGSTLNGLSQLGRDQVKPGVNHQWHAAHFVVRIVEEGRRRHDHWAMGGTDQVLEKAARIIMWYHYLYREKIMKSDYDYKDDLYETPECRPRCGPRQWLWWFEGQWASSKG